MRSTVVELVRIALLSSVAGAMLGILGCRSDILKEPALVRDGALAARVQMVEGDCPGLASVASAPAHCAWPASTDHSMMESAVFQVVAHVGPDGHAESVQVVDGPPGSDAAASACAMQIAYRPFVADNLVPVAGDTCRVSFRLARYVSDINPSDPTPLPCPPVRSRNPQTGQHPGTSCD